MTLRESRTVAALGAATALTTAAAVGAGVDVVAGVAAGAVMFGAAVTALRLTLTRRS